MYRLFALIALVALPLAASADEYDPVGRRDPFAGESTKVDDACTPETPLRCFDLSQMELTGVISGIRDARALITLPDGNVERAGVGDQIGRNDGTIVSLRQAAVVVIEHDAEGLEHETVLQVGDTPQNQAPRKLGDRR